MTQDPKTGVKIELTDAQLYHYYTGFGAIQDYAHRLAEAKGFWPEGQERNQSEQLMLMVTELAEACEGIRHGNPRSDKIPRFSSLEEELADCIIRILDMAGGLNLNLAQAVVAKLEYNSNRPHKHGKEF